MSIYGNPADKALLCLYAINSDDIVISHKLKTIISSTPAKIPWKSLQYRSAESNPSLHRDSSLMNNFGRHKQTHYKF